MTGVLATGARPAETDITPELVSALVDSQFPQFSGPLAFVNEGWDNVVYRLGDSLAVRVPRHETAAQISESELDWLPRLSAGWTFPVPVPVAGRGGRPWLSMAMEHRAVARGHRRA